MSDYKNLTDAADILKGGNARSKHLRNAIAYIQRRIADAPICFDNFFRDTEVEWYPVFQTPSRPADFVSASGSQYWACEEGVIRASNHYGVCAGCYWPLAHEVGAGEGREPIYKEHFLVVTYAAYKDFKRTRVINGIWHWGEAIKAAQEMTA